MDPTARRLAALFLAGGVLFLSPFVAALNRTEPLFGYPAPLLFLFLAWGVLVVLACLIVRRGRE